MPRYTTPVKVNKNLMEFSLLQSGKLFHIDFGYILGRDPKPMPPPMKLSKEMIEAFGGMQSDHFQVSSTFTVIS